MNRMRFLTDLVVPDCAARRTREGRGYRRAAWPALTGKTNELLPGRQGGENNFGGHCGASATAARTGRPERLLRNRPRCAGPCRRRREFEFGARGRQTSCMSLVITPMEDD